MRYNVYNEKIMMISSGDIDRVFDTVLLPQNQLATERLRIYSNMITSFLSANGTQGYIDGDKEVGILIIDEIDELLRDIFVSVFKKACLDSFTIQNAYLYATVKNDSNKGILEKALVDTQGQSISREEFTKRYGEHNLDYTLIHGEYSYPSDYDKIADYDENIALCHDGIIEGVQISPNAKNHKGVFIKK